jgi:hypothetical protein
MMIFLHMHATSTLKIRVVMLGLICGGLTLMQRYAGQRPLVQRCRIAGSAEKSVGKTA